MDEAGDEVTAQGEVWKMCHTASLKDDIGDIYASNDECGWLRSDVAYEGRRNHASV